MNSVPVAFVDSLVAHLSKCALRDLFLTSGNFASRAAHHYRQRRYLDVYLKLEGSDVGVEVKYGHDEVPFQLDPLFDRIVRIESTDSRNVASKTVPMDRFENSVLPALRSVMDRCRLLLAYSALGLKHEPVTLIILVITGRHNHNPADGWNGVHKMMQKL
ncbi:hypothetical protein QR680_007025 [Steinernema hermaphroditum]|uniref:Uncharacterized protein n=1 Tax=Steinernema hermaphroditum TaxID=289476 RepID=A0AA39HZQ8_9BILA|nr:hypothetical protein QR680_007025 [Steinernema hermaphroditum]